MRILPAAVVAILGTAGVAEAQAPRLGPKDPARLPASDTARVAVGSEAPDFTLEALAGPPVSLSQFRGRQNVVLVFYRGHW